MQRSTSGWSFTTRIVTGSRPSWSITLRTSGRIRSNA